MHDPETPHTPLAGNDNRTMRAGGLKAGVIMALRFYSRLPTGSEPHLPPDLSRMAKVLPLASLAIGAAPALSLILLGLAGVPVLFAAPLAIAIWVTITGAMSEDALADAADGLFGGATAKARLAIMKDSRQGSYGVLAIVLLILLRVGALSSLVAISPLAAGLCWLAATVAARSYSLYLPMRMGFARTSGAAAAAGALSRNAFVFGAVLASGVAALLAAPAVGLIGLAVALVAGGAVLVLWTRLCDRLVGGVSGDLIGASQALVEIALLAAFMLWVG